ncbi:family 16 glycosylhydrolase [Colwellia sp. E2M01]|uniref:family 16 glycosylhydrolase n=1 Tax=Colwellia sp. E2M01 TaxID=2841561 RepID=UPI001C08BFCC|nr:family 16 glycosylhydrolase [Colwellia sp. E2M01]MBU2870698.1 family 16 glycosylhydrolase [Colwellia sp. E2M01]
MNKINHKVKVVCSVFTLSLLTACGSSSSLTSTSTPVVIDVNEADTNFPSFVSFNDTTPENKAWEKIPALSDEFDVWDETKWFKPLWNYGGTPVYMRNENAGVSDGNLWIQATLNEARGEQWFETSRVQSKAKVKYPMYTESRIKAAHISAYNTFWLNNGDIANRDEIDIIENNSNPSYTGAKYDNYPYEMHSQYFIVKDNQTERKGDDNPSDSRNLSDANTLKGVPWNEQYHVFGAWWKDEHTVQFYLNGEPVNSVVSTQAFTLEQNIIWDLWTQDSSWVGGVPEKNDLLDNTQNTMKVDWVRTWQLVDKVAN